MLMALRIPKSYKPLLKKPALLLAPIATSSTFPVGYSSDYNTAYASALPPTFMIQNLSIPANNGLYPVWPSSWTLPAVGQGTLALVQ